MKNSLATRWNPIFDDKPTIEVPRIRFSEKFSRKYFKKRNFILEIGCGTGSYFSIVDRRDCIGLDLNRDAIKIAKKYCLDSRFIIASATNLPFRAEIFDVICMWEVFEEIPKGTEEIIMAEVRRTLRSKAVFLLSVSNDHLISKILDPAFIFQGSRHYNLKRLLNLISDCGFSVTECTIRGGVNTIIANFLFFFCKHVLNKKKALIKTFFDKKSTKEFDSSGNGIVYIFIAANKN